MNTTRFVLKGPAGKTLEVRDTVVAGRSPECDLVLVEGHPSRRHAKLTCKDDSVWLEDLGSANGTFVNQRPVGAPVALQPGDRIRFDAETWEFTVVAPPELEVATVMRGTARTDHRTVMAQMGGAAKTPGSWADPDLQDGQGTKLFDPRLMQKMSNKGGAPTPAVEVDAPHLSVKSGQHVGQNLKLKSSQSTSIWEIGSNTDKDIVITDDGVSGYHAKITNEGKRWKLIDQMSANGTFVNGQKSNVSYLASGDEIRFGPVECVFQLPADAGRRSTRKRPPWAIAGASFAATAALIGLWWWLRA
jgi:pSer/pThr/pTyr-binding forkhead associated (FHA) protein